MNCHPYCQCFNFPAEIFDFLVISHRDNSFQGCLIGFRSDNWICPFMTSDFLLQTIFKHCEMHGLGRCLAGKWVSIMSRWLSIISSMRCMGQNFYTKAPHTITDPYPRFTVVCWYFGKNLVHFHQQTWDTPSLLDYLLSSFQRTDFHFYQTPNVACAQKGDHIVRLFFTVLADIFDTVCCCSFLLEVIACTRLHAALFYV